MGKAVEALLKAKTAPEGRSISAHVKRVRYEIMMAVRYALTISIVGNLERYVKLINELLAET